jgi:hypothetical protein
MSLNALSICFAKEDSDVSKLKHGMSFSPKKCSSQSPAVLPSKILKIKEYPLEELYGQLVIMSDVMDIALYMNKHIYILLYVHVFESKIDIIFSTYSLFYLMWGSILQFSYEPKCI